MNAYEILMESILYGVLLEKINVSDHEYKINRNRLISSDPNNIKRNVSNLVKNEHMGSVDISNIMIQMLITDVQELYDYARIINPELAKVIWKKYRLSMRNEIESLNNSNLLNFKTNGFKQYTSQAINDFQKIIAKDKNSAGYRKITSAGYENHIIGFKRYFDGMKTAMNFFLQQKDKVAPKAEGIVNRVVNRRNPRMEAITDDVKNLGINATVMILLYIVSVELLKKMQMKPKSYINLRHNFGLIYEVAADSDKYGWTKSWLFRIFFIIIGIGLYLTANNTISLIRNIVGKKQEAITQIVK